MCGGIYIVNIFVSFFLTGSLRKLTYRKYLNNYVLILQRKIHLQMKYCSPYIELLLSLKHQDFKSNNIKC